MILFLLIWVIASKTATIIQSLKLKTAGLSKFWAAYTEYTAGGGLLLTSA